MAAIREQDFNFLRGFIRAHAAIALGVDKSYLVETRLMPLVQASGLRSLTELIGRLKNGGDCGLVERVVDALATHETSFFRDRAPFEVLQGSVLPRLIEARAGSRTLRIWSGACASGQEPYSLAILLAERFPDLADWRVQIHGSDLSLRMVERCRAATYSKLEIQRGLSAEQHQRWLVSHPCDQWQMVPELRSRCSFAQLNLTAEWPYGPRWDMVLLRNVLIYFEPAARRRIIEKTRSVLQPDGVLVLGASESAGEGFARLGPGIYQPTP